MMHQTESAADSKRRGAVPVLVQAVGVSWLVVVLGIFLKFDADVVFGSGFPTVGPMKLELAAVVAVLTCVLILPAVSRRIARVVLIVCGFAALSAIGLAIAIGPVGPWLLGTTILLLWSYGAGRAFLRLLRAYELLDSKALRVAIATGLGLGVLSHTMLLLGIAGGYYTFVLQAILLAGAAITLVSLARRWRLPRPRSLDVGPDASVAVAVVAILGVSLIAFLLGSSPEIYPDPVEKYVAWPLAYLAAHRLTSFPDLWSYFHQAFQVLFIPGFVLGGEQVSKYLAIAFGLLTALTVQGVSSREFRPAVGAVASALFLSAPLVMWQMGGAESDLAVTFYVFATMALLATSLRLQADALVAAAAVTAAFALAMKLSAAPFILAIALTYLVLRRPPLRLVAVSGLLFLVVASPWFVLRFVQTGNPVFPFLNDIFKSNLGPPVNPRYSFDAFGMGKGLIDLVRVPLDVTLHSQNFVEAAPNGMLGPAALICFAIVLVVSPVLGWRRAIFWLMPVVVGTIGWFETAEYLRYLLPIVPILALAAALVLFGIAELVFTKREADVMVAMSLALFVAGSIPIMSAALWRIPERVPIAVVFGRETSDAFLRRVLFGYPVADAIRVLADEFPHNEGGVLMVTPRSSFPVLYAGRPGVAYWDYSAQRILNSANNPDARVSALRLAGYRWVVLYPPGLEVGSGFVNAGVASRSYFGSAATLVFARSGFLLYDLTGDGVERHDDVGLCAVGPSAHDPSCWQTWGDPVFEAQQWVVTPASGFWQKVDICGGGIYRVTESIEGRTPGASWRADLVWRKGNTELLRDTFVGQTQAQRSVVGGASSAPRDADSMMLLVSSYAGRVAVGDVHIEVLRPCSAAVAQR